MRLVALALTGLVLGYLVVSRGDSVERRERQMFRHFARLQRAGK